MHYLLFFLYLAGFCLLINRISFIKNAGLDNKVVLALFIIKILAGLLIGWMTATYYPEGNDYWNINKHAWEEYQLLINDPRVFITGLFDSPYPDKYGGFFSPVGSWWNDLANNLIIKFIAICNIITRGNYYINSLFFNFFVFFGHVALYRVYINLCTGKKWPVIAGCFLIPSAMYFTSGIHKDGVVFTSLALFCYALYFSMQKGISLKYLILLLITSVVILLMRNYLFFAMIPAVIAYLIALKYKRTFTSFAFVYAFALVLIIITSFISDKGVISLIAQRQKDFLELPIAASQIPMDTLQPNLESFILNSPSAINHGFLRPYVWEFPGTFLMVVAIELLAFVLLFLYILTMRKKMYDDPIIYFGIFLAISVIIFAGYIVPNAGSLVRYRSLYLPFLMIPVFCAIWNKPYYKK